MRLRFELIGTAYVIDEIYGANQEMERSDGPWIQTQETEISFDDIEAADDVVIQTENSTYAFMVIDPSLRQGILRGGPLGARSCEAVLACALRDNDCALGSSTSALRVGMRVLFYIRISNRMRRLITSAVTHLDLNRGDGKPKPNDGRI